MPKAKFGQILRKLRRDMDITQEKLAEIIGVSKPAVGNWEQGNRFPRPEELEKLASFFDVTVDYLMGKSELKRGRFITDAELKTFLPAELIDNNKLKFQIDELELKPETKQEIIDLLMRHGYLK